MELEALEKIRSAALKNTLSIADYKAHIKCMKKSIKKYRQKVEDNNVRKRELESEINNYKYMNKKLSTVYENSEKRFIQSLEYGRYFEEHTRTVENDLKNEQSEYDKIIDGYSKVYDDTRKAYEESTPLYAKMQKLSAELNLNNFKCLDMRAKIERNEKINKQRQEIQEKLFYSDFITLADRWVNNEKYLKEVKDLEKNEKMYEDSLKELHNLQEKAKNVRHIKSKTNSFARRTEFDNKKIEFLTKELEDDKFFKEPTLRVEPQNNNKVRILENFVVKTLNENNMPVTKSAISMKIDRKRRNLEKMFKKYAARSSRNNSFANMSNQNFDKSLMSNRNIQFQEAEKSRNIEDYEKSHVVCDPKNVNEKPGSNKIQKTVEIQQISEKQDKPICFEINKKKEENLSTFFLKHMEIDNIRKTVASEQIPEKHNEVGMHNENMFFSKPLGDSINDNQMEKNAMKKTVTFDQIPEKHMEFSTTGEKDDLSMFFPKTFENPEFNLEEEDRFRNPISPDKLHQMFQNDTNNFDFNMHMGNMTFNINGDDNLIFK